MTLGQRIQQIRNSTGLSQEAFGAILGTSRQTVSKWELDQTIPEITKIVQISKMFSVTTDSILIEGISTFDTPYAQFTCGVYKSDLQEIVETEKFSLVYYCTQDHLHFGTKLYKGIGTVKKLCAFCEYDNAEKRIVYAYETEERGIYSNDKETEKQLGEIYDVNQTKSFKRTETFFVNHNKASLPGVDEAGIKKCLTLWRMSDSYQSSAELMLFTLCTGKTDYVFQIAPKDTNIYCGISYQIPFDFGMLSTKQFFRIRNYQDNSQPWCQFFSNLGYEYSNVEIPVEQCELGKCIRTTDGYILWGVKRYANDEIVLQGCGDDEYSYYRESKKEERFSPIPDQAGTQSINPIS